MPLSEFLGWQRYFTQRAKEADTEDKTPGSFKIDLTSDDAEAQLLRMTE